jgi:hypothetical protein
MGDARQPGGDATGPRGQAEHTPPPAAEPETGGSGTGGDEGARASRAPAEGGDLGLPGADKAAGTADEERRRSRSA